MQHSESKEIRTPLESNITKVNFWRAYDALGRNLEMLRIGLQEAIQMQVVLVQRAIAIINKKEIVQSGPFRYVLLNSSSSFVSIPTTSSSSMTTHLPILHQRHYFVHPLSLARLGHFLVDTLLVSCYFLDRLI